MLIELTVAVASMLLFAWKQHRIGSLRAIQQKIVDFEISKPLVEEAIDDRPTKGVEAIANAVKRDMRDRGYDPRLVALVTPDYVDELRRAKKRRMAARHQAHDERKRAALRKGSPYRIGQPIEADARKRNLQKLLETAGLNPEDLDEAKRRR